jgi:nucleoside-diphosphate-sugar epimerase
MIPGWGETLLNRIKVLVTGAYGLIGNAVFAHLASQPGRYEPFGMVRRMQPSQRTQGFSVHPIPPEKLRIADLIDLQEVHKAVEGIDVVVHLAADPDGRSGWESVRDNNLSGTYHLFEACRIAGVRRVIFASTNQVIFGYKDQEPYKALFEERYEDVKPADIQPIDHTMPVRPLNLYASSKVWGESLAHQYAMNTRMSCLVLRIGWVVAEDRPPQKRWGRFLWCSQRDIVQLIERSILAPDDLRFDIFFGHSDNLYRLVDLDHARAVIGYQPQDRAENDWNKYNPGGKDE